MYVFLHFLSHSIEVNHLLRTKLIKIEIKLLIIYINTFILYNMLGDHCRGRLNNFFSIVMIRSVII